MTHTETASNNEARILRILPDVPEALSASISANTITEILLPVEKSDDTSILFNTKYHGWRYDGKDFDEDNDCWPDPRGEHYMEEMTDDDHGFTENYQSVGHCPHGLVGDTLLVNGVVAEIKDVYLDEMRDKSNGAMLGWSWMLEVTLLVA